MLYGVLSKKEMRCFFIIVVFYRIYGDILCYVEF